MKEPALGYTEVLGEHASNPPPRTSGIRFHMLGEEWIASTDEARLKAQFEQWVRYNAEKFIMEMRRTAHQDEVSQYRSSYMADVAAGSYNWDGAAVRKALSDIPGMKYMTFLLLKRCQEAVTLKQVHSMWAEDSETMGRIFGWALGNVQSPDWDPGVKKKKAKKEEPEEESDEPTMDGD